MLDPDRRSLTTSLLTPPPGMVLDQGLATTYSLDLLTLLTAPVHLALLGAGPESQLLTDPVSLHEAIRRVTERLTIYTDRGRIQDPGQANILLSLLEPMVVEVQAPHGGAFHAKIWVLRFVAPGDTARRILRLTVLTRNLTSDRSWDLALQLEGEPSQRYVAANRELGEFVRDLPDFAVGTVPEARRTVAMELAEELRKTPWDLPGKWEEASFHVLGRTRRAWRPPDSSRLAVMSPFLGNEALSSLIATTQSPVALIARDVALKDLEPAVRSKFGQCLCLDEAAETEDGEETTGHDQLGLHAKAYVMERGWHTHLFIGSANATDAALIHGSNIEVLAELRGRRSRVGDIEKVLGADNLGSFLHVYTDAGPSEPVDAALVAAEKVLDNVRRAIAKLAVRVRCISESGEWRLHLITPGPLVANGLDRLLAWPLTINAEQAADVGSLIKGDPALLMVCSTEQVTGLIGFELRVGQQSVRFVLNLPVDGLPADREDAILRKIIHNRESFMRYLLLLLGEFSGPGTVAPARGISSGAVADHVLQEVSMPLLEDLVRALSRDPGRLREIQKVIRRLDSDGGAKVIPQDFREVWQVLALAVEEQD